MIAISSVLLFAALATVPVTSFNFLVNDYVRDQFPLIESRLINGTCETPFQPYFVDFDYEDSKYLLSVYNKSMDRVPRMSLYGDALWFGDNSYTVVYSNIQVANYTVHYNAYVGSVNNNAYKYSECLLTASTDGYIMTTSHTWVNNATRSSDNYASASNWISVHHAVDACSFGTWDISAECPGVEAGLVHELVQVAQKVYLARLRDVFRDALFACSEVGKGDLDVNDYCTD